MDYGKDKYIYIGIEAFEIEYCSEWRKSNNQYIRRGKGILTINLKGTMKGERVEEGKG